MQTLKQTLITTLLIISFTYESYAVKTNTPPNVPKPPVNQDPPNPIATSKKSKITNVNPNKNAKEAIVLPLVKDGEDNNTDESTSKIEVIPKSKEISYEVRVTNVIEDKSSKDSCKLESKTSPEIKSDDNNKIILPDLKQSGKIVTDHEKKNLKPNSGNFKDDPPIDVSPDTHLEFGLVNVFPLSKIYSLYLEHSHNFNDYYEISHDVLKSEVPNHPYNSKVLSIIKSIFDQIQFNSDKIDQMNNDLEHTQLNSARTIRMLKLSEEHHRQVETASKQLELNFKNWTSSLNFTKDKLVLMSQNLENIEKCISTTSMHQCQKHFDFFFDFLNLSNLFKEDTFCTYSSICEIVLKKRINKDFKFEQLTTDLKQARDSNLGITKLIEEIKKDELNLKAKEAKESYKKKNKSIRAVELKKDNEAGTQEPVKKGNSSHLCFLSVVYVFFIILYFILI